MTPYVLGIDSGGTKYLVRAAALDGAILGEYRGDSCNHYDLGIQAAANRIEHHLAECLRTFGGLREDCAAIVCGSTGYDSPEDGELLQSVYDHLPGFKSQACCMNDVELAHYTVTGGTGILALAGTGSILFGRSSTGREGRVGGWMKSIFGDEGGGRYLDAKALQYYSRWLDGCRPDTPLLAEIEQKLGRLSRKQLMELSTQMATPPWPAVGLGPAVDRAAEAGDPYALEILEDAAARLFDMTDEAIRVLGMEKEEPLCVGLWGSVLLNCRLEREAFCRLVSARYPQASFRLPVKDAAQGAVEIALQWHRQGGDWRDILRGAAASSHV